MQRVEIDWSTANVASVEDGFALEVGFRAPFPSFWWGAFTGALETLSRETTGARWRTIGAIGEPPRGLHVSGVDEESAEPLRQLLDGTVALANQKTAQAEEAREARQSALKERADNSKETAARLTEMFRKV